MQPSPSFRNPMKLLRRLYEFVLLSGMAALYGGALTARLQEDRLGYVVPDAPYVYEARDFYVDAVLAGLAGMALLWILERWPWVRRHRAARALAFLAATVPAIALAPPSPIVFGNTWLPQEILLELILGHWDLALPLMVAATFFSTLVWRRPSGQVVYHAGRTNF